MDGIRTATMPRMHSAWATTACSGISAGTLLWNSCTADPTPYSHASTSTTGMAHRAQVQIPDRPHRREIEIEQHISRETVAPGCWVNGAGDGDRARDIQLGTLGFYRSTNPARSGSRTHL